MFDMKQLFHIKNGSQLSVQIRTPSFKFIVGRFLWKKS